MKQQQHQSNESIIEGLLHEAAWANRLATHLVGVGRADDLLQETWLQAMQSAGREPIRFPKAWLANVMRRRASHALRTELRRRDRETKVAQDSDAPSQRLLSQEQKRTELVAIVMDLPEIAREIIVLRFFEERTPLEIAGILQLPASTVRSRLLRALEQLRTRLAGEKGDDWRVWCIGILPMGWQDVGKHSMGGMLVKWAMALVMLWGSWEIAGLMGDGPQHEPSEVRALMDTPSTGSEQRGPDLPPTVSQVASRVPADESLPEAPEWLPVESQTPFHILRGQLLTADRKPVAGMRVVASNWTGKPSALSDSSGQFALSLTGAGPDPVKFFGPSQSARLTFEGANFMCGSISVDLENEVELDLGSLLCTPAPHRVRGRVLDHLGGGAPGAMVYFLRNKPLGDATRRLFRACLPRRLVLMRGEYGFVETDESGRFEVLALPGEVLRTVIYLNGHEGFLGNVLDFAMDGWTELGDIQMEACLSEVAIAGQVLTVDGQPASNVLVGGRALFENSSGTLTPIRTDSIGAFCIPVPRDASCLLEAVSSLGKIRSKAFPAGSEGVELRLERTGTSKALPVELESGGLRLHGVVHRSGEPVAGAWITYHSLKKSTGDARPSTPVSHFARSDLNGSFVIELPEEGPGLVRATARTSEGAEFGWWEHEASAGQAPLAQAMIELQPAGTIQGRLVGIGSELLVGARIRATSALHATRVTTVRLEAQFTFENMLPGAWQLGLARSSGGFADSLRADVEVSSGELAQVELGLEVARPSRVLGTFLINGMTPRVLWDMGASLDRKNVGIGAISSTGAFSSGSLEVGRLRWHVVSRGMYVQGFTKSIDLVPGDNFLDVEVSTGSLELAGLPVPDRPEDQGKAPCALTWEGPDGLSWTAYLSQGKGGELVLEEVPVGTLQLRYLLPRSRSQTEESPVVAEIEIRRGEPTRFTCPVR